MNRTARLSQSFPSSIIFACLLSVCSSIPAPAYSQVTALQRLTHGIHASTKINGSSWETALTSDGRYLAFASHDK